MRANFIIFLQKIYGRRIIQFASVGALSTFLDIGILNIFLKLTINPYLSAAAGFVVGSTNSYFLNSGLVFKQDRSVEAYAKYSAICFVGLVLTEFIIAILHVKTGWLSINYAKLVAIGIVFFWNYGMSKMWAFKELKV